MSGVIPAARAFTRHASLGRKNVTPEETKKQKEVSVTHAQRLHNGTLSFVKKIKKNSLTLSPSRYLQ